MKCVPAILRAENHRLGSPLRYEEVEDLIQDTLAAVWGKIDRFLGEARLETWAYPFCVLELRSALRRPRLLGEEPTPEHAVEDDGPGGIATINTPETATCTIGGGR